MRVLPYRFKDPTNLCRIKPPCTNLMKAFLTPKGLMVKSGELVFSAGKLPTEKMIWVPVGHPQFDQAVAWAEGEGLL